MQTKGFKLLRRLQTFPPIVPEHQASLPKVQNYSRGTKLTSESKVKLLSSEEKFL